MNCRLSSFLRRPNQVAVAMTLLEMIGVLAIIAVLAGIAIPVAIRYLDRVVNEKEAATLRSMGDAFQEAILRTRSIPGEAAWHVFLSTNAGVDIRSLTNNIRSRQRILQFDPDSSWFSANALTQPYIQSASGTTVVPDNARVMIISCTSGQLPFTVLDADEFGELWDSPDGTLPAGPPWTGWDGDPHDVKVHRINLAPLFVRLVLSTYLPFGSGNLGYYSFEGKGPINAAPATPPFFSAYFLRGTELNLRSTNVLTTPPDHTHLLQEDTSFVYENGVWQSSIIGPMPMIGIGDLTNIVDAFLNATPNINSHYYTNTIPRTQQVLVVETMIKYMSNYNLWVISNFTKAAKDALQLETNQAAMMDAMQGLYSAASKWTNVPPPNYIP